MDMFPLRHIVAFFLFANLAFAAEPENGLEVRLVAERLPKGLGEVVLVSGEDRTEPFVLPMNNLSAPKKVPGRVFQLISPARKLVLAKISLPQQGNSFVVLLIPSSEVSYKPVVVPFKNPKFKAGDIYLHNNAKDTVIGIIGAGKFSIAPDKGSYFRPKFKDDEKRYHDVAIGVRFETGNRVISTTRWPKSKTTRYYVFFYENPKNGRVTYRAVDEYIEPLAK
jgi:hypothetical protein